MVLLLDRNSALTIIDRVVVWLLLAMFLVMMLSGFMLTKGFIDRYWGFLAHVQFAIPTMAFFTVHVSIRVRFFLLRRRMKEDLLVNLVPAMFGAALFLPVLYLDLLFRLG